MNATRSQWLSVALVTALCITGALFVSMNRAFAHALLVRVAPAEGASIAPGRLVLGDAFLETVDLPVQVAIWIGRIAFYVGLFIDVGGAFFANWIGDQSSLASRAALWSIAVALIATPLSVGLQGLDALGMPLSGLSNGIVWKTGYATSDGMSALAAMAALVAGLIAIFVRGGAGKALSLLDLLSAGLALAASGHASATHPQWLTRPTIFLHAVGIAFWAGSLIPLVTAFSAQGHEAIAVLRRFSQAIPFAVLPLVASGMVLALIQLGRVEALWSTAYGQVLAVKLILLAALLVLAAINRFWLTEPAERGDPGAVTRLRRSIRIEVALVLAIFTVAALWHFTRPPALAETVVSGTFPAPMAKFAGDPQNFAGPGF